VEPIRYVKRILSPPPVAAKSPVAERLPETAWQLEREAMEA
jgi:hypothetical protein